MLTLEKACELATKTRNEPYLDVIIDIGHSFVMSTLSKEGLSADIPPLMLNKENGSVGVFFPPQHLKEFSKGKNIEVPIEYQFKK